MNDKTLKNIEKKLNNGLKAGIEYLFEKLVEKLGREHVKLEGDEITISEEAINKELGTPGVAPNPIIQRTIMEEEEYIKEKIISS